MYFPVSALLIEYLILTIVESQDSYGYEISQTIKLAADIKESTLYPILKKMEKAGSYHLFSGISGTETKVLFYHARGEGADDAFKGRMVYL